MTEITALAETAIHLTNLIGPEALRIARDLGPTAQLAVGNAKAAVEMLSQAGGDKPDIARLIVDFFKTYPVACLGPLVTFVGWFGIARWRRRTSDAEALNSLENQRPGITPTTGPAQMSSGRETSTSSLRSGAEHAAQHPAGTARGKTPNNARRS